MRSGCELGELAAGRVSAARWGIGHFELYGMPPVCVGVIWWMAACCCPRASPLHGRTDLGCRGHSRVRPREITQPHGAPLFDRRRPTGNESCALANPPVRGSQPSHLGPRGPAGPSLLCQVVACPVRAVHRRAIVYLPPQQEPHCVGVCPRFESTARFAELLSHQAAYLRSEMTNIVLQLGDPAPATGK